MVDVEVTNQKEKIDYRKNTMNLLAKINKWILEYKLIILFLSAITPVVIEALPSLGRPLSFPTRLFQTFSPRSRR